MTGTRMGNMGIVVESLDAAISFFTELGLELEGRATIEGEWAGRVTGLPDQRVEIAVINPALKGRALWKDDVEHEVRPLSCFDGCPRAAFPPQAEPSDSHGFSGLSQR